MAETTYTKINFTLGDIYKDWAPRTGELSSELIWTRAYKTGEQGDSNGWRMSFSVLYGDMVVTVRSKGVDPDWIYKQLASFSS